jgi:hypothetical protein
MSDAITILIITTLIGVTGFLLRWFVRSITKKLDENTESINATNREMTASINKLQLVLTGLNGTILSLQTENDINKTSCKERHKSIDEKLNDHEERIRNVEGITKEIEFRVNTLS